MLDIVSCAYTYLNQSEQLNTSTLNQKGILRRSSRALHRVFNFTLCLSFVC